MQFDNTYTYRLAKPKQKIIIIERISQISVSRRTDLNEFLFITTMVSYRLVNAVMHLKH